ncbi:MAG: tetratricopeptide repeat protein, partial [Candidatus Omnitrophica bacterium]|nr:tetratricopeptide repeat protein [Candidatus Omnitrophota bacterium]
LANWIVHWKKEHTGDFIFQHYIGGTPDSTDHWKMIKRLMTEIKKWADDPDKLPTSHDDIVRDFPLWLSKVRLKAERDSVQCILVLDALNQLDGQDNSRFLGWLPPEAFTGPLHLVVSTLPGDTMDAVKKFGWETLHIEKLTKDERRRMIVDYLNRFGKKLDLTRIDQIIATSAAANPLYLKILLDELRITGTHDKLDERLNIYLAEPDVPALLKNVLIRYQCHYERDREGLVKEALGLIFSARRGLSETELLQLLRPADLEQLPQAVWTPLRAAMEELLIDRGGILNFAHEFLRTAVKETFVPGRENQDDLRLWLAGYFEAQTASSRSCDELPWLLQQTKSMDRLRTCLLNVDCFLEILKRDINELRSYWIGLNEQMVMGKAYLKSFEKWVNKRDLMSDFIGYVAYKIAYFLHDAALYKDAEPLYRRGLSIYEKNFGKDHPNVATGLCSLAGLLRLNDRMDEAEPLMRRALAIDEKRLGNDHPNVAMGLSSLARLLKYVNRLVESEPLMRRALSINEKNFGKEHPKTASDLSNLAGLFSSTNRLAEAEQLMRKALSINEKSLGKDHPNVALNLNNIAILLKDTNRIDEAESLYRRTLGIYEKNFGKDHPSVAISLTNFANLLKDTNRIDEAESLYRRALGIYEKSFGNDHTYVATCLGVFAQLLKSTNRMDEAELLMRRALGIYEKSLDENHPYIATALNILSALLKTTNRVDEAEPLIRRALSIYEKSLGKDHPHVAEGLNILAGLLEDTNRMDEAEALYRRMLSIREKNNGPDSWQFASALNNLSVLYRKMGRFAAAEPLSERSVTTYEKSLGHGHPNTPNAGTNLAYLKFLMNKSDEAAALCFKYLDAHRENQEKTGSIPTTQLKKLADCYHALAIYSNVPAEKWKEAEDHCRLSLEYFKRLEDSGGFAKAEQLLNQVLKKKQSSN